MFFPADRKFKSTFAL